MRVLILGIAILSAAQAQWALQESHTTASLRGIHNVGMGVAWASGTNGTVLRTIDDGTTWKPCVVPRGAEKLDFRGIQAFDEHTAIVMSAGAGDLSRIYKTRDACQTWDLVLTNPDKEGFWDAIQFSGRDFGVVIGDQVDGRFPVLFTHDGGSTWKQPEQKGIPAEAKNQSIFAASNSALLIDAKNSKLYLVTGGGTTSLIRTDLDLSSPVYTHAALAVGDTAGGFSLAARADGSTVVIVAVGGDYKAPRQTIGTAVSDTPPHGYRSAVAWYAPAKTWIAVGPNGTDISADDGRNWHPMPDADGNWNALSLPFVAGSGGRIGKLRSDALRP